MIVSGASPWRAICSSNSSPRSGRQHRHTSHKHSPFVRLQRHRDEALMSVLNIGSLGTR